MRHWLLPEYIEDILPGEAAHIEALRRKLLDLFATYGYQYVIPPMLEYVESLNTGVGHDLDLATFKVVDQLSGRMLGLRADMTPQAARIDAHLLNQQGVTRLCYAGTVVRTHPDGLAYTREPLQIGAELFGYGGVSADIEILRLMLKSLQVLGVQQPHIDLGHVGIFADLIERFQVDQSTEEALQAALNSKDVSTVLALTRDLPTDAQTALVHLTQCNGDISELAQAAQHLPQTPAITKALQELQQAAQALQAQGISVGIDLAELRGYYYHSGLVFGAFAHGYAGPLALGGRYDKVGKIFGRARAGTGFSIDLRGAVRGLPQHQPHKAILAPHDGDAMLDAMIEAARAHGETVIQLFSGQDECVDELQCDRRFERTAEGWHIVKLALK